MEKKLAPGPITPVRGKERQCAVRKRKRMPPRRDDSVNLHKSRQGGAQDAMTRTMGQGKKSFRKGAGKKHCAQPRKKGRGGGPTSKSTREKKMEGKRELS